MSLFPPVHTRAMKVGKQQKQEQVSVVLLYQHPGAMMDPICLGDKAVAKQSAGRYRFTIDNTVLPMVHYMFASAELCKAV
jgi:hypothetical protein